MQCAPPDQEATQLWTWLRVTGIAPTQKRYHVVYFSNTRRLFRFLGSGLSTAYAVGMIWYEIYVEVDRKLNKPDEEGIVYIS